MHHVKTRSHQRSQRSTPARVRRYGHACANTKYQSPAAAQAIAATGSTIGRLVFYRGITLIGSDTTPVGSNTNGVYDMNWLNVPAGSYSLTARTTDSGGHVTTSAAVGIIVDAPPQITLLTGGGTAQTSQTIVTGPNAPNIILNVNVTDTDGTVSQVQLFGGITSPNARPALLGTAALTSGTSSNGVYSYNWGNLAAGAYTFYWAATDNLGATGYRFGYITVAAGVPPTVSLNAPAGPFTAPAAINLTATAADVDGTVQSVALYRGAALIGNASLTAGTSQSGTYSFGWTNVAAGNYTVTAIATDNLGFTTTSNAIQITVNAAASGAAPGMYFVEVDHLNTPRRIQNFAQQTVWAWAQGEPFGNDTPNQNPNNLGTFDFPLRLIGTYADQETNTFYNYFRQLDPGSGRYMQFDPLGLRAGINGYAHVSNSPLRFTDPFGLAVTRFSGNGVDRPNAPSGEGPITHFGEPPSGPGSFTPGCKLICNLLAGVPCIPVTAASGASGPIGMGGVWLTCRAGVAVTCSWLCDHPSNLAVGSCTQ